MAIDSLGTSAAVSYSQFSSTAPVPSKVLDSGEPDAAGAARPPASGGKFVAAIAQALAQVGGAASTSASGTTSATGATDSSADAGQAEAAFAQSLFTALQSQAQSGAQSTSQSGSDTGAVAHTGGHHHHGGGGGGGKIASGLQQLAQQVSASTSSSTNSSTTAGTAATDAASNPALSGLQTSFDNLLAANGQSGASASLPQFLQALSQNLQGASSSGNVVSTKA